MNDSDESDRRRALLLIDFQYDFLSDDGRMPVDRGQVEPVMAAANSAIARARHAGDLIVRIGNEFRPTDFVGNLVRRHASLAGSPGSAWDPRIDSDDSVYVAKWKGSAFCNPELPRLLDDRRVGEVQIAGLYARACVTATAGAAQARGLTVVLLADAIACKSGTSRSAALARLARRGMQVLPSSSAG